MPKFTDLPATAAVNLDDLLCKSDDPGGTAVSESMTMQQLVDFLNLNLTFPPGTADPTKLKRRTWMRL